MDARTNRRQKRLSKQQEKRVAGELGGRVQANSGAARFSGGGDVRVLGHTRVECKYTEAISYTLRLSDLTKLRTQALQALENPVLQFQFRSPGGIAYYSFAVVRAIGERETNKLTTSRQMNFHEIDLNQFFHVQGNSVMRIVFYDKKKDHRHEFDVLQWRDFLAQQEETNA